MIIDDFPDFYQVSEDYSQNIFVGASSTEASAARSQWAKEAWANNPERRQAAADSLNAHRSHMGRATILQESHKAAIGKSMRGNQNKTGKPGRNQHMKEEK